MLFTMQREDATRAVQEMDGFEIRGRRLRVSLVEPNASGGAPGMLLSLLGGYTIAPHVCAWNVCEVDGRACTIAPHVCFCA